MLAHHSASAQKLDWEYLYHLNFEKTKHFPRRIYPIVGLGATYGLNIVDDFSKQFVEIPRYLSMNITAGFQSVGNSFYDQLWRYPEWGIRFTVSPFSMIQYLEIPMHSICLWMSLFMRQKKKNGWRYSYSLGGGLSYNFRPNNPQDNPWNTLIGSYNNVYIEFGFWAGRNLGKSLHLKGGLSFILFSNGAGTLPNMGMNMLGPKFIMQHSLVRGTGRICHARSS